MVQLLKTQQGFTAGSIQHPPCVSLMIPFEPSMNSKQALVDKLEEATDQIDKELRANYPEEEVVPVLEKLHNVIKELNYNTLKKSIAIFVSRLIEKVYYLDLPLQEKIIIDDSFEIRELIYNKKVVNKYLLAALSPELISIYIGSPGLLIPIVVNQCDNITGCKKQLTENCENFIDDFLRHTDKGLSLLLKSYPLPLFVMGTQKILDHFKAITHTSRQVIEYIPGQFDTCTELELHKIMEPYVADWRNVKQEDLLRRIAEAARQKKLYSGIKDASKAASQKRVKLLLVERSYRAHTQTVFWSNDTSDMMEGSLHTRDLVDDVIEKVLTSGGDVEFVDDGLLTDFHHIALIEMDEPL